MFVMLPCGGVGVRENTHTHTQLHFWSYCKSPKLLMKAIQYCVDERRYCFKEKHRRQERENDRKHSALKRKRELAWPSANVCLTVRVGPWQVSANENNMSMTRDKRNASDFIVRARWTVMPVCEQTEESKKKQNGKENYQLYGSGHFYSGVAAVRLVIHVLEKFFSFLLLSQSDFRHSQVSYNRNY